MGIVGRGCGLCLIWPTVATLAVVGCATPAHFGRCHLDAELAARTGHTVAPDQSPCGMVIPDFLQWEDGLSEDEAVALALWNNAAFRELLVDLEITRADLIQAQQLTNPQVWTVFPVGVKQWELMLTVPLDVLWLRPRRVSAAELESKRVVERLVQDGLNLVRDVRVAYTDLVLAEQQLQLAREGERLRNQMVEMAEARWRAGAVAELDISPLRLDALVSEQQAVLAGHDVELARQRLDNLMGVESADIPLFTVSADEVAPAYGNADDLVTQALGSRPDLSAVRCALEAACQRARLARVDYFNFEGVLPDINSAGKKGFEAGPGLRMHLPILNQNQGAIARAEADVHRLQRQYDTLCERIALEVRQAHTRLARAQQALDIWRGQIAPQAEAAVNSARNALQEDGVSLVVVLEATRQWLNARARELEAAADARRALAELERSVGACIAAEHDVVLSVEEVLPAQPMPELALPEIVP